MNNKEKIQSAMDTLKEKCGQPNSREEEFLEEFRNLSDKKEWEKDDILNRMLMSSVQACDIDKGIWCLERGARVAYVNNAALKLACFCDDVDMVRFLLSKSATPLEADSLAKYTANAEISMLMRTARSKR